MKGVTKRCDQGQVDGWCWTKVEEIINEGEEGS